MLLRNFLLFYREPDSGASGGSGGDGGGAASSDSSPGSSALGSGSDVDRGVFTRDVSMDGSETPVDELKAGIKKAAEQRRKETGAVDPATTGDTRPAASPAPAVAAAAPQNGWTPNHYGWGEHYGLSKAQVESFGSPQAFAGWVSRQQYQRQQQARQPQPVPAIQHNPQNQPANGQQQPPRGGYQPFTLEGDINDYEPSVVKLVEHFNGQMQAMHAQLETANQVVPTIQQIQQFQQQQARAADQQNYQQINERLESLDPEVFGKATAGKALDQNHMNSRFLIGDALGRLEAGYQQRGEALPPLPNLIDAAYRMAFGDRIQQRALAQASAATRELRGQTVAMPTHREQRQLNPRDRAVKAIADKLKEQAVTQGEFLAGV